MPKFSVIIPVYMTEQYIKRCIESVLAQTFTDYELILVDDGSPDNCGAICDKYAKIDPRVVALHQENAGVSTARNRGIDAAQGEYVVFIDSDDWVSENYLLDLSLTDADLVCNSFSIYDESGMLIKRHMLTPCKVSAENCEIIKLLRDGALSYMISKRFKTDIIKKHGIHFAKDINHSEDTLFIIDYLQCSESIIVEDIDNYYYIRYKDRDTLSNGMTIEKLAMVCTANSMICKRLLPYGSEEYESLYYSRIGYNYISYIGNIKCSNLKGAWHTFKAVSGILKNEDVQKVIEHSPDALWKLPVHKKIVEACYSGKNNKLLIACFRSELSKIKTKL